MTALAQEPAFVRLVDIPFAVCVDRLERLRQREDGLSGVRVGRSQLMWMSPARQDCFEVAVQLHHGAFLPRLRMRLRLLDWSSLRGKTHVELVPCRSVRAGARYYAAGHALLDALIAEFGTEGEVARELTEAI
jgi:hypothetical protein